MGQLAQAEWRPVSGYESQYEVSSDGRVRSIDREELLNNGWNRHRKGRVLKQMPKKTGYMCVNLYKHSHMRTFLVHRIVASAFIANPDGKPEVNHINGNKHDNRVENLEWVSESENIRHSFVSLGKRPASPNKKLTDNQVRQIRAMSGAQKDIAKQFGVSRSAIQLIKSGKTYKEIQ